MRKSIGALSFPFILIIVLAYCGGGGYKPPMPQPLPEPPQPVCDNTIECGSAGACNPPECKPTTHCDKTIECGKPNACEPPNCKPTTEPPPPPAQIKRDHSTHRALGNYTVGFGQPEYDPVAEFKLYKKSLILPGKPAPKIGFNARVMFVKDSWQNKDFWAQKTIGTGKAKTIDLTKRNPEWWNHAELIVKAMKDYDVEADFCIFTDYGHSKWQKFKGIASTHPYRTNTQHNNIADGEPSDLYTNWNRRLPVKDNCKVMSWKEDDEYNIDYYKPCGASGKAFMEFVPEFAALVYKYWKDSDWIVRIRTANEPVGVVEADGKTFIRSKGKLLDDRTENYVIKTFLKAGFKVGPRFTIITENETNYLSVIGPAAMYWPDKTMKITTIKNNWLMEWHNICSTKDHDFFTKTHGFNTKYFNGSSDGCDEGEAYKRAMNSIAKTNPLNFDYKLSADYVDKAGVCHAQHCWKDWDVNYDVMWFVPPMEAAVFK